MISFFLREKKLNLKRPKAIYVKVSNPPRFTDIKGSESLLQHVAVTPQAEAKQMPRPEGDSPRRSGAASLRGQLVQTRAGYSSTDSQIRLQQAEEVTSSLLESLTQKRSLPSSRLQTALWRIYKMRVTYRNHRELTVHSFFIYIFIFSVPP